MTGGPPAPPASYRVVLMVDGVEYAQTVKVESDPVVPASVTTVDEPRQRFDK